MPDAAHEAQLVALGERLGPGQRLLDALAAQPLHRALRALLELLRGLGVPTPWICTSSST